ncbi:MAG: hypothetical protein FJ225_12255 [Lentisphaerae bacterium]|nr:hypothetical protein [Lentisphaerota bacterium]
MMFVIADDITGAVELAGIGWRYGLTVALQRDLNATPPGADLLVLDTDSRSLTEPEARESVALAATHTRGADWVYKKVDSVLRGPVRAECTELAMRLGRRSVRLCPANPSLGRRIEAGCLRIAGVPLSQTAFARDPEWPATTDRVSDLLARSSGWPCRTGEAARSAETDQIAVGDVASAADPQHWAGTVDETVLPAGGGDFFEALLQRQGLRQERRADWVCPAGPCLLVCGSTAASSRAVVDRLEQAGRVICDMPNALFTAVADSSAAIRNWSSDLSAALGRNGLAVLAIRHPVVTDGAVARRLAAHCAEAVRQVLQRGRVRSLLIEGGATAAAILAALGYAQWEVAGEVQRGVGVLRPRGLEMDLVLKPGSYPWPENVIPNTGNPRTDKLKLN